tara:strand:- start:593 stop:739 length:147 start_codon:yes stop_codon:yes gene_type:complete
MLPWSNQEIIEANTLEIEGTLNLNFTKKNLTTLPPNNLVANQSTYKSR